MSVKPKKKNLLLRMCVCAFSLYAVFTLIGLQVEISTQQQELAQVKEQVNQQDISNKELERVLSYDQDEDYIGRVARDKLDLAYPDEKVYKDISGS